MRSRLEFGRAIETLRAAKTLSREEVASSARISYSYLSEIERGQKRPSTDVITRIARALGMKTGAFMQYVEELSAPLPEEEPSARAVQLPLKRGRPLPLFAGDQEAEGAPRGGRRRRGAAGEEGQSDLILNELLVLARRLGDGDRAALLHLARHLLHRRA